MESIETYKGKVPKNLQEQREKQRAKVIEILSQPLLPIEQEKVYSQLSEFVTLNFGYEIVGKYPSISAKIFNLERDIKVEVEGNYYQNGTHKVSVPSLVKIPFKESNNGSFKIRKKAERIRDKEQREIELSCTIPEITPEARSVYADSIGFCAELVSKAYKDGLISRILLRDLEKGIPNPLDSTYSLVWAPSVWDAKAIPRPERDPAIFMEYNGWNFLVHKWDIPEERSLDAMLREFSQSLK